MRSDVYVMCFRKVNVFGANHLRWGSERDFIWECLLRSHDFGPREDDEDKGSSNRSSDEVIEQIFWKWKP